MLFDQLIADGQSAWVFLEFTALSLPNVIRLVLPMSAFAAALYVTNRMSSESELTVVQATGYSARGGWRVRCLFRADRGADDVGADPFPGAAVDLEQLKEPRDRDQPEHHRPPADRGAIRLTPARGVTVYIREITPEGELLDVFLSDTRPANATITYTAAGPFWCGPKPGRSW